MRLDIEILMEEEIINLAEAQARREVRPLSDLIQDALVAFLKPTAPNSKIREKAYRLI